MQRCRCGGRPEPSARGQYSSGRDMRTRVIVAVVSAMTGFGFSMCAGLAAQLSTGQSSVVPLLHRPGPIGLRPCFPRSSQADAVRARVRGPCRGQATSEAAPARQPDLPAFPAATGGSARSSRAGHLSRRPRLRAAAGDADVNHHVDRALAKRQLGNRGRSVGFKFAAGIGTPADRLSLEGPLSPYQQPNGNTSAAMSGSLTNKIEAQGMHFGFELQY